MFGYVQVNKPELKIKDFDTYHGFYCGLCQKLKENHGRKSQILLNYDMTFLAIVLSSLYELEEERGNHRCLLHPLYRQTLIQTEATAYAADMSLLLYWQKFKDDWLDDKEVSKKALAQFYRKEYCRVSKKYPRQAKVLSQSLRKLSKAEKNQEKEVDLVASYTGDFLAEMFDWKQDIWSEELRTMGFYLGKFIYLADAAEDLEEDLKKHHYNVFLLQDISSEKRTAYAEQTMMSMMAECSKAFERLPILEHAEIMRNILYSGVWCKYAQHKKKNEEKKK